MFYDSYLMVMIMQVSLTQARIDMSELDEDSDGFLQQHVWILILLGASHYSKLNNKFYIYFFFIKYIYRK